MVLTPLHYTECILNYAVLFGDDKIKIITETGEEQALYASHHSLQDDSSMKSQLKHIISSIKKYAQFFSDISLQSSEIQKYSYKVQGLYSVLAAREVFGVKPVWNKQFDEFTGLNKHKIKQEIDEIKVLANESEVMEALVKISKQNQAKFAKVETPCQRAKNNGGKSPRFDNSKSTASNTSKVSSSRNSFDTRKYTHFSNFSSKIKNTKETEQ